MYPFPLAVGGDVGLHRSPWMRSKLILARNREPLENGLCVCFPTKHDSHSWLSLTTNGRLKTNSCFPMVVIVSKLACPSLACHNQSSLLNRLWRHIGFLIDILVFYNLFIDLFILKRSVFRLSNISRCSPFIENSHLTFVAWPKLIIFALRLWI